MVKEAARKMLEAGYSVIPIRLDGSKSPSCMWAEFAETPPTPVQFENLFRKPCGVGATGWVNGLETLDFETDEIYRQFAEIANEEFPGLLERLPRARTPGGGVHVYIRSECAEGNQKLAKAREPYIDATGKTRRILIESRGQGGYAIVPPSPGECHPSGVAYRMMDGVEFWDNRWCEKDERHGLFRICRSLNQAVEPQQIIGAPTQGGSNGEERPGEAFNLHGWTWRELLEPTGATKVRERKGIEYWRRPGKPRGGSSATIGAVGDRLFVFSTEWEPFECDRAYDKFGAYTQLRHGGDFKAAARELRSMGFGDSKENGSGLLTAVLAPPHISETSAEPVTAEKLFNSIEEDWDRWESGTAPKVVETPIPALNEQLGGGLEVGMVTTILGYTNVGKSEVVRQFRRHMAMQGHGVVHVDVELGWRSLIQREIAQCTGIPSSYIRGKELSEQEWAQVRSARAEIASWSNRIAMLDLNGCVPLGSLEEAVLKGVETVRPSIRGDGEIVIAFDSLHKLAAGSLSDSPRLQVTEFMHWCIKLGRSLSAVILVVGEQKRTATGGRPSAMDGMTSGAESRSIEFDSHYMLILDDTEDADEDADAPENILAPSERVVRCRVVKSKEGMSGWCKENLVFKYPDWGFEVRTAESCESGRQKRRVRKDREARAAVLEMFEGNRIWGVRALQRELNETDTGLSSARIQRVVADLYESGVIVKTEANKYVLDPDRGVSE